jgi:hypothetical protein
VRVVLPPVNPRPRRIAVAAEALAYLGGALGVLGLVLLAIESWDDFSLFTRLALAGLTAGVLAFGGLVLSDDREPSAVRLRQFMWLGASAAVGVVAWVVGVEWLDAASDPRRVLVVSLAVAASSGLFWWWRTGVVQHVVGLAAAVTAVGAASHELWDLGVAGAAIWVAGTFCLVVALTLESPGNWLTGTIGGTAAVVGSLYAAQEWPGPALLVAAATAASLLLLAAMFVGRNEAPLQVGLTVVGIVGLVQSVPPAVAHFADQAGVNTGLVISIIGALLVLAGFSDLSIGGAATTAIGAIAALAGAAVTGVESADFATVYGSALAVLLVAAGTTPGHIAVSVVGLAGLVGFVPWGIARFFPGETRAPFIVLVVGLLVAGSGMILRWISRRGVRRFSVVSHRASGM